MFRRDCSIVSSRRNQGGKTRASRESRIAFSRSSVRMEHRSLLLVNSVVGCPLDLWFHPVFLVYCFVPLFFTSCMLLIFSPKSFGSSNCARVSHFPFMQFMVSSHGKNHSYWSFCGRKNNKFFGTVGSQKVYVFEDLVFGIGWSNFLGLRGPFRVFCLSKKLRSSFSAHAIVR